MIVILHNENILESREFVAAYGDGVETIYWERDLTKTEAYRLSGNPHPSSFPSVVDTDMRDIVTAPVSLQAALETFKSRRDSERRVDKSDLYERIEALYGSSKLLRFIEHISGLPSIDRYKFDGSSQIRIVDAKVRGYLLSLDIPPDSVLY